MSDLPGILGEIAGVIGEEQARLLGEHYAGMTMKLPSRRTLDIVERDHRIKLAYNGANAPELARRFGISRRRVYQILEKG